jgi:hypothetical protein
MRVDDVEAWIRPRYGPIRYERGGGVVVAFVPLWRGVAVGLGSNVVNAVCDLYLGLSTDHTLDDRHLRREPWEVERREAKSAAAGG